jgi:probable O-glycosylation ligase (exosortase A-associated)
MFQSRRKVIGSFLLVLCIFVVITFAPQAWMQRMSSTAAGQLDRSAEERLFSWQFALNLVQAYPITGGGFEVFSDGDVKIRYAPPLTPQQAALQSKRTGELDDILLFSGAHSIYFQTLGEQGLVGLALFLALLASCFISLRQLRRIGSRDAEFKWLVPFAQMLQLSFAAYAVSGAFLGRAYFDLYFTLIACTILLKVLYRCQMGQILVSQHEALLTQFEPVPL